MVLVFVFNLLVVEFGRTRVLITWKRVLRVLRCPKVCGTFEGCLCGEVLWGVIVAVRLQCQTSKLESAQKIARFFLKTSHDARVAQYIWPVLPKNRL